MIMNEIKNQILEWIECDKQDIIALTQKLIACRSDKGDTTQSIEVCKNFLSQKNLAFEEIAFQQNMPNILASLSFGDSNRHLMLNGHLDTMPAGSESGWIGSPYSGRIKNGKIYGRGAQDMKAGVVAMLFAYHYIAKLKQNLNGKISLSLVSDEESGYGRGTGYCFETKEQQMLASCVLSAEPSGKGAISFASKGYMVLRVVVQTKGAIAGYASESENAIFIATQILNDLKSLEKMRVKIPPFLQKLLNNPKWREKHEQLRGKEHTKLLSQISVDVGSIKGGDFACTIAPFCCFDVSIVLPLGSDIYKIYAKAREIVASYQEAQIYLEGVSAADYSNPKHEMVQILQDIVKELGQDSPEPTPEIALSDCRYWRYRGIPAFWYGVDGDKVSQANESVEIDELLHIVRTYTLSALSYLCTQSAKIPQCSFQMPQSKAPSIKIIPAFYALCLKGVAKSFSNQELNPIIQENLENLFMILRQQGQEIPGCCFANFTQVAKSHIDVIVGIAFANLPKKILRNLKKEGAQWQYFPRHQAITMAHFGDVNASINSWKVLFESCKHNAWQTKPSYTEFYLINAPEPPHLWISELQIPLADKGGAL